MDKESVGEEILEELEVWRRSTRRLEVLMEKWKVEVQERMKDRKVEGGKTVMAGQMAVERRTGQSEGKTENGCDRRGCLEEDERRKKLADGEW